MLTAFQAKEIAQLKIILESAPTAFDDDDSDYELSDVGDGEGDGDGDGDGEPSHNTTVADPVTNEEPVDLGGGDDASFLEF